MSRILSFFEPVIVVGNGPVSLEDAALAGRFAKKVIAADGGADSCERLGLDVFAVLGDLDSVSAAGLQRNAGKITHLSEQATTDFEKCIYASDAPLYLCIGFLGGRLDHELAALNVLAKYPDRRIVLIGEKDIAVLCPQDITIDLPLDTRVSLFPLGRVFGVCTSGLKWSLTQAELASAGQIGVSNISKAEAIRVSYDTGALLLIVPVACIENLLAAF